MLFPDLPDDPRVPAVRELLIDLGATTGHPLDPLGADNLIRRYDDVFAQLPKASAYDCAHAIACWLTTMCVPDVAALRKDL